MSGSSHLYGGMIYGSSHASLDSRYETIRLSCTTPKELLCCKSPRLRLVLYGWGVCIQFPHVARKGGGGGGRSYSLFWVTCRNCCLLVFGPTHVIWALWSGVCKGFPVPLIFFQVSTMGSAATLPQGPSTKLSSQIPTQNFYYDCY